MIRAVVIAVALGFCVSLGRADVSVRRRNRTCGPRTLAGSAGQTTAAARRWFEDGALVLDGMASIYIADMYKQYLPSLPVIGEEILTVAWGLRVDEIYGFGDPGVTISMHGHGNVTLVYCANNRILSSGECEWVADYEPAAFHKYTFTTADLDTYILSIDSLPVHSGPVGPPMPDSYVAWGDSVQGAASRSTWQYMRVTVARPGDVNGDAMVDFADINPFVSLLTESLDGGGDPCAFSAADVNQDGAVDFGDINPFIELLTR